jgi:hypothetical protein
MSSDDEFRDRLIGMGQTLLEATREGKISWRLTDVENKFVYAGTRSSVTIQYATDQYDGDTIILCLLNSRGVVVDSLESGGEHTENGVAPLPWNDLLDDLYHAARRVVHNVDEALESMLHDIARGAPSPPAPAKKKIDLDPWATEEEPPPF